MPKPRFDTPSPSPTPTRSASTGGPWRVQLGAFGVRANADKLWDRIKTRPELAGHGKLAIPAGKVTKLQAGGFASQEAAQAACNRLKAGGFDCIAVDGTENPAAAPPDRIESLDLIRGVAVLGILAINIGGFAGPSVESISPNYMGPVSPADEWTFAAMFLLFEGKMRALFTLLFGASLLLFIERSEAAGRPGLALQLRRLLWLGLFGYLHYLLFWWGDILFYYALAGLLALPFCRLKPAMLAAIGLAIVHTVAGAWHGRARAVCREQNRESLDGTATAADAEQRTKRIGEFIEMAEREELGVRAGLSRTCPHEACRRSVLPIAGGDRIRWARPCR